MTIPAPFVATRVDWDNVLEMALLLEETVAFAVVQYGPNASINPATPTGLANDATVYTATVVSNDGTSPITVTGTAAQTFATLITEINADLATADCTAAIVGNTIVITKDTDVGAGTFVTVTDTGAFPLFASVKKSGSAGFGLEAITSTKGNDRWLRWDKMDGVLRSHVDSVVDAFLAGGVANTNVSWSGGSDAISFPTGTPTALTATGLDRDVVYQLNVEVDGASDLGDSGDSELYINLDINQLGSSVISFSHLLQAINNALSTQGFGATASFDAGSPLTLRITSNTVGTTSTVVITEGASAGLIAALAAFGPVEAPNETAGYAVVTVTDTPAVTPATATGLAVDDYAFTLTVDAEAAADFVISIAGATTMTQLAALMEAESPVGAGAFTVDAIDNTLVITSATTGLASQVLVTRPTTGVDPDLFDSLETSMTATVSIASVAGTDADGVDGTTNLTFPKTVDTVAYANWLAVLGASQVGGRTSGQYIYGPTGYGPLFTSGSSMVFERENKPAAKGNAVGPQFTYFDDAGVERYFDTDVAV